MRNFKNPILLIIAPFLLTFTFLLSSCTSEQPKCDGNDVKEVLFDIVKEQLQKQLEENYFRENYNYSDVRNYARDNGLDEDEVNEEIKNKIKKEAREYSISKLSKVSFHLNGIRLLSVQENLKKRDCAAELIIDNIEPTDNDLTTLLENMLRLQKNITSGMEIKYTAQYTEDDKVYVEAYY